MKVDVECLDRPGAFHWSAHDPAARVGFADKAAAAQQLAADLVRLAELQDVFSAARRAGLLVVIQGIDAAGKDGIVKHVMSGLNPQGVSVYPFRAPSDEEREHDYLWRATRALPERGRIAIFNRSYYEDVLVVRVHPELLERDGTPPEERGPALWAARYEQINAFERYLSANGVVVLKFFMHLSREEQLERLLARIDVPDKRWKFSAADLETPQRWEPYRDAYAAMLEHTATAHAPWYVIPADRKWAARVAVANVLVERLAALGLRYPQPDAAATARLTAAETYIRKELGRPPA